MGPPKVLLHLLCAAGTVMAQASVSDNEQVWAAVIFVNHGESTPALVGSSRILTPTGAQQMQAQGDLFRKRYITSGDSSATVIPDMSKVAIDNSQVGVSSLSNSWVSAGATAFLQGLYPPSTGAIASPGDLDLSHNLAATGNTTSYPLNGYQYPNIKTYSVGDVGSIFIDGTENCAAWQSTIMKNVSDTLKNSGDLDKKNKFYTDLFSTAPLQGTLPIQDATYLKALEIFDFVKYQYSYNKNVHDSLKDADVTLQTLQKNAHEFELLQVDDSQGGTDDISTLHNIAGRTLLQQVSSQLSDFVSNQSSGRKVNFIFGSSLPMASFFSIAGLLTRQTDSTPIGNLTQPGAAIMFELVGNSTQGSKSMPSSDRLNLRFSYRPGTGANDSISAYPLFGSPGNTMPYAAFTTNAKKLGKNSSDWCQLCGSAQGNLFCGGNQAGSAQSTPSNGSMSPAVSGIIGAIIMLAITGLAALLLFVLGGFRINRARNGERNSKSGGFKGAEKMASDADVRLGNRGTQEERIGSWEMGGHANQSESHDMGIVTSDFLRAERRHDDDGASSINHATAVHARESV